MRPFDIDRPGHCAAVEGFILHLSVHDLERLGYFGLRGAGRDEPIHAEPHQGFELDGVAGVDVQQRLDAGVERDRMRVARDELEFMFGSGRLDAGAPSRSVR
jgi:hypothetical protein